MKKLVSKDWNNLTRLYSNEYVVDNEEDIDTLPTEGISAGSAALCVGNGSIYMMNASGEWQKFSGGRSSDNGSSAAPVLADLFVSYNYYNPVERIINTIHHDDEDGGWDEEVVVQELRTVYRNNDDGMKTWVYLTVPTFNPADFYGLKYSYSYQKDWDDVNDAPIWSEPEDKFFAVKKGSHSDVDYDEETGDEIPFTWPVEEWIEKRPERLIANLGLTGGRMVGDFKAENIELVDHIDGFRSVTVEMKEAAAIAEEGD